MVLSEVLSIQTALISRERKFSETRKATAFMHCKESFGFGNYYLKLIDYIN
jgi:hypothetical protein